MIYVCPSQESNDDVLMEGKMGDKWVYRTHAWIYIRNSRIRTAKGYFTMSYDDALEVLSRDERFKATVYAMNTLLIHKGIYTQEEFQELFVEWARKEELRKRSHTVRQASEVSV